MPLASDADLLALIDLVGDQGARAALRASKVIGIDTLRRIAEQRGHALPKRATRADLIDLLVGLGEARITRSIDDLSTRSEEEIARFFADSGCSRGELVLYLNAAGIPHDGSRSKTQLIADAAREISRIGVYQRISSKVGPNASGENR